MTRVLVVPDGLSELAGATPTTLEAAHTPALDALARRGDVARVQTIPKGTPPGTEVGLPALFGLAGSEIPSRGRLEAAAAGVELGDDQGAWRLDVLAGRRPADVDDDDVRRLDQAMAELGGRVHRLRGHRLLLTGPASWGDAPVGPHQTDQPLRGLARGRFLRVGDVAAAVLGGGRSGWPWGRRGSTRFVDLPARLGCAVTMVTDGGAAEGLARLLGCSVARAIPDPLPNGLLVVHLADADEAAHARDRIGKVAAAERLDALVATLDVDLTVCPDHGCDPTTGAHLAEPVPLLRSRPGTPGRAYSERAAADRPVLPPAAVLAQQMAAA